MNIHWRKTMGRIQIMEGNQVSILKFGKEVMRETKLYFVCLLLI